MACAQAAHAIARWSQGQREAVRDPGAEGACDRGWV